MLVDIRELRTIREKFRDKKIVFAGGVYDLLHAGHIDYFKMIKALGDILIVAVSSDKRVRERKGENRPIQSQEDRAKIIDAIKYVDYVMIAPDREVAKEIPTMYILKQLRPDVFVTIEERWSDFKNNVEELDIELKIIAINKVNSTTSIIEKIKAQN